MELLLIDDQQRCNFCVYWTGKRKKEEDFVYVALDSVEQGICRCPKAVMFEATMAACDGCSRCRML